MRGQLRRSVTPSNGATVLPLVKYSQNDQIPFLAEELAGLGPQCAEKLRLLPSGKPGPDRARGFIPSHRATQVVARLRPDAQGHFDREPVNSAFTSDQPGAAAGS
jgi:hypothetical protein